MLAGTFYGGFLTASRWLAQVGRPRALMLTQLVIGELVLAPFGLMTMPLLTLPVVALSGASALGSMLGNLLLILALRLAPASRVAPFVYMQLVAATALGWIVFGDLPGLLATLGLALLIVTGLASLTLRERP